MTLGVLLLLLRRKLGEAPGRNTVLYPPMFAQARMVMTVGGYAYTRDDGVLVVPIGALGP